MQFSSKKVFVYDQNRLEKYAFEEVVKAYSEDPERLPSKFALSGLDDLAYTLKIIEEYYERNFPKIQLKELRRGQGSKVSPSIKVDPLYNEPADMRRQFSRILEIPAYVAQEDKNTRLLKQGAQTNHIVEFCVGMINLYKADYYPEIGDEIVWMGSLYHIGEVIYKKNHLHQNTAFPLHVTMKTSIRQFGDEALPTTLTSKNTITGVPTDQVIVQPTETMGHGIPVLPFDN